jgi:hypothetical protein
MISGPLYLIDIDLAVSSCCAFRCSLLLLGTHFVRTVWEASCSPMLILVRVCIHYITVYAYIDGHMKCSLYYIILRQPITILYLNHTYTTKTSLRSITKKNVSLALKWYIMRQNPSTIKCLPLSSSSPIFIVTVAHHRSRGDARMVKDGATSPPTQRSKDDASSRVSIALRLAKVQWAVTLEEVTHNCATTLADAIVCLHPS